ncbi:mycofactocin biosynthesis peptidyl-dipeptidase MftE [uncultured Jatrophihabitans sp.]|uniref:mycofactocin biosynthesis peptidyl-dipeptidase MftE n=1 Tax=uncultured Jatrophihabitans sp. TaxID=1610747 RepID=UPI0035CC4F34
MSATAGRSCSGAGGPTHAGVADAFAGDLGAATSRAVPVAPTLLVPLGSVEQHGPHLPLATDSVVAQAVAERVATRFGAPMVVAPVVAFGSSGEHAGFPGTISIGRDALALLLVELVRSAADWAARIVLVNGHGGNVPTLVDVVARLRSERHAVAWAPCAVRGGDAHAGRAETSLMMCLRPQEVQAALAEPGETTPLAELMPALLQRGVRGVSPNGVLGDPRGASAAEGARLLADVVADVAARISAADVDERGCLRPPVRS